MVLVRIARSISLKNAIWKSRSLARNLTSFNSHCLKSFEYPNLPGNSKVARNKAWSSFGFARKVSTCTSCGVQRTRRKKMDEVDISDLKVVPCEGSRFIQSSRVVFKQNGQDRLWDYITEHDDVSCLMFNTTRKAFVLVKQFRPAVYMHANRILYNKKIGGDGASVRTEDPATTALADPQAGVTYEMCAGIIDQNVSLVSIMKQELFEECGYDVPEHKIQKITSCHAGVGSTGAVQTLYYAEVTDDMIVSGAGGGNTEEGERIEVYYLPLEKSREFVFDETLPKPSGLMFAFMWYFNKFKV